MKDRVIFYNGDETGFVIEKDKYGESIFSEQYRHGLKLVEQILSFHDGKSNIIAFCGDRGEGKTSCMLSFNHFLDNKQEILSMRKESPVSNVRFYSLEPIDPAFFDQKHNLIELILGQMYGQLKSENFKSEEYSDKVYKRNILLQNFQKAKVSLAHLEKERKEMYDELEELTSLSAGVNLKKEIRELFNVFLEYFQKDKLVIPIDDLDLNMIEGYNMAEQIRKYLNNDKCIILIGLNVSQLSDVIEATISKDISKSEHMSINTRQMASKYVVKLIPFGNRIVMPHVDDIIDRKLEIRNHNEAEHVNAKLRPIKDEVLRLIFKKTRFLFYNSRGGVSPIIPRNLRNLRLLLGMLLSMDDFQNNESNYDNKYTFLNYFYNEWTKCLNSDDGAFVFQLVNMSDYSSINKFVVSYLIPDFNKILNIKAENIKKSFDIDSHYDYSVGDVLAMLDTMELNNVQEEKKLLFFFIRSFYSMRLYELYDIISENDGMLYPERNNPTEVIKIESRFESMNYLQRFLNGSYFTYDMDTLLPKRKTGQSRDFCVILGKPLIEALISIKNSILKSEEDFNDADFQHTFRCCEFFILTTIKSIAQRDKDNQEKVYRDSGVIPSYATTYNQNTGYFVFDVLSPFYNMVNVEYAYRRFSEIADIFDFAKSHDWTILGQMVKYAKESKPGDYDGIKALLSDAVIRNAEVHSSLMDQLRYFRFVNRGSSSNSQLISYLYRRIMGAGLKIYDFKDGNSLDIKFRFLQALIDYLDEEKDSEENSLFYKIFADNSEQIQTSIEFSDDDSAYFSTCLPKLYSRHRYPVKGGTVRKWIKDDVKNFDTGKQLPSINNYIENDKRYNNYEEVHVDITEYLRLIKSCYPYSPVNGDTQGLEDNISLPLIEVVGAEEEPKDSLPVVE